MFKKVVKHIVEFTIFCCFLKMYSIFSFYKWLLVVFALFIQSCIAFKILSHKFKVNEAVKAAFKKIGRES